MRYSSTNMTARPVGLDEAVNRGIASDGGLFMPEVLPSIPRAFFNNISEMSLRDIAFVVATSFFGNDIDVADIKNIVDYSFSFEAPVRKVGDIYVMELYHGPTLTFKDYGSRFMAAVMRCIDRKAGQKRNVLVATTGNTGAAAANGLHNIPGINVIVLYPKGKLKRTQIAQITALGRNIYPVEVAGTIEDCKNMVQRSIADPLLSDFRLTGANSLNVARLIPQLTFAMHAYSRLKAMNVPGAEAALHFIPSGNMSNAIASVMARLTGSPLGKVVAATGANNQIARLMNNEVPPHACPLHTLAPSIDMTVPSGWPRMQYLFKDKPEAIADYLECAPPVSDDAIADTVRLLRNDFKYNIDTHGAVAYCAAMNHPDKNAPKIVYATGHPAKQVDIITKITNRTVELPEQLTRFMTVSRPATILSPTLPALKKFITTIQ